MHCFTILKKLTQVIIVGNAELITNPTQLKIYWANIQEKSKKDYTTKQTPGTAIKSPDAVEYNFDNPNFCVLKIKSSKIEYLQLKRPNHLRVSFHKEADTFKGQFLVP